MEEEGKSSRLLCAGAVCVCGVASQKMPPLPAYVFGVMIRPFCITILYHNLLLFIDIFHI
jgi:hypothetical protein